MNIVTVHLDKADTFEVAPGRLGIRASGLAKFGAAVGMPSRTKQEQRALRAEIGLASTYSPADICKPFAIALKRLR